MSQEIPLGDSPAALYGSVGKSAFHAQVEVQPGARAVSRFATLSLYSGPSPVNDIVAQLNFGEVFTIVAVSDDNLWLRVQRAYDSYEGWVYHDRVWEALLNEEHFQELAGRDHGFIASRVGVVKSSSGNEIALPLGAVLPFYNQQQKTFIVADQEYTLVSGKALLPRPSFELPIFYNLLQEYLSVPYLWGGENAFGIDCSGLVKTILRPFGIRLARDSGPQSQCGREVSVADSETGDIVCFGPKATEQVNHVGIILRPEPKAELHVLHAFRGEVAIEPLAEDGSFFEVGIERDVKTVRRVIED